MAADDFPLCFRVDADAVNGTGHFMRCLALAQYWRAACGPVSFAGRFPRALERRLEQEGISVFPISMPHPEAQDLTEVLAIFSGRTTVVIDGYHFDAPYHDALAAAGHRLMIIDDTAHLGRYGGEILLNQNIYADELAYEVAPARKLLGLRYALLNRAFRDFADRRSDSCEPVARNLLVTMGGADPGNATLSALQALAAADADFNVRVVAGAANRHVDSIQDFCHSRSGHCELLVDTAEMPAIMDWAELAIAAAGTTSWELLYMGVPTVFVAIAANQEPIGAGIERHGAGIYLGRSKTLDWSLLAETSLTLASDDDRRRSSIDAGRHLVDGDGVVRVAEKLQRIEEG